MHIFNVHLYFYFLDPKVEKHLRSLFFVQLFLCCFYCQTSYATPKSNSLETSFHLTNSDTIIKLDGYWEFYWKQLLEPGQFDSSTPPGYKLVPKNWESYTESGIKLSSKGYATFRTRVTLPSDSVLYAFYIPWLRSSYKIWVDNRLLKEIGKVGESKALSEPQFSTNTLFFSAQSDSSVEVVIQVANFHLLSGGIRSSILLGSADRIQAKRERALSFEVFFFGAYLVLAIYHLLFFFFRPTNRSPLWFGLICLVSGLAGILTNETFVFTLWPSLSFVLHLKFEYFLLFTTLAFLLLFIHSIFPGEANRFIEKLILIAVFFLGLSVVLFPPELFIPLFVFSQALNFFGFFYFGMLFYSAIKNQRPDSMLMAVIHLVLLLFYIVDILVFYGFGHMWMIFYTGIFFYLLAQAVMLARRFAKVFDQSEEMAVKLTYLDKLKDEFLANTSHELKSPLNAIAGIAQNIENGSNGPVTSSQVHNLRLITQSAFRLSTLVNDILDLAKIKNDDLSLELKPVDVASVCAVVLDLTTPLINTKKVEIVKSIPDSLPLVLADENRLYQIVHNLINNAVKFTHQGQICISAVTDKGKVYVEVSDTGIGISPQQINDIFNPFTQIDSSSTRVYGGTGLGLSITKKLIELHGGTIVAQSTPEKGSRFSFDLPIAQRKEPQTACDQPALLQPTVSDSSKMKKPGHSICGDPDGKTILIIDDDIVNLNIIKDVLTSKGYSVYCAKEPGDGLELLKTTTIDLVLLDLMMPKMSGSEVCAVIRQTYSVVSLPVIILTAKNLCEEKVALLSVGANDYMTKPFHRDELLVRVSVHLQVKDAFAKIRQMQEELLKNAQLAAIGELAAGVAHEVATPVNTIINSAQILTDLFESEERYSEFLGLILQEGGRIDSIVKSLLSFARVNSKGKKSSDIEKTLFDTLNIAGAQLRKENIRVKTAVSDGIPPVLMNPGEIQQVFFNLISNSRYALKSVDGRKRTIFITIMTSEECSSVIVLFQDNGCGIAPEILDKLTLPFVTTKPEGQGTGLGLSISYGIITDHNGTISFDSEEGSYTRVTIKLPLYRENSYGSPSTASGK